MLVSKSYRSLDQSPDNDRRELHGAEAIDLETSQRDRRRFVAGSKAAGGLREETPVYFRRAALRRSLALSSDTGDRSRVQVMARSYVQALAGFGSQFPTNDAWRSRRSF